MKYKLLVLDVDGTLLDSEKKISKRTLAALLKVQQMGVRIVLASGRPTYGLMPIAKALELGNYGGFILSYNGGQIINAQSGELLFERRINPEMLPYLEKKSRKNGFAIFTYHEDTIITDSPENEHIRREAELNGLKIIAETEFSIAVDFAPCKCMLVSDDEEALVGLEDHWRRRLNGALDVFRSEPYFLEVVPCSIDKSNTLGALLEKLGINSEEVIAIGDGVCDVSMIQSAGLGIAMGNAQDSVKVCADRITASNDEDGVAEAVEKAILAEIRPADVPLEQLNQRARHALMGNLGIQYTYASEDRVEATMPVDERTRQPFGILHGGASLALAETVAGLGSMILCKPDEIVVGMHTAAAPPAGPPGRMKFSFSWVKPSCSVGLDGAPAQQIRLQPDHVGDGDLAVAVQVRRLKGSAGEGVFAQQMGLQPDHIGDGDPAVAAEVAGDHGGQGL